MKGTHRIPVPPVVNGGIVGDPAEVEIGNLLYLAQQFRLPAAISKTAARYRYRRNKLAHLTPLNADDLCDLLEAGRS